MQGQHLNKEDQNNAQLVCPICSGQTWQPVLESKEIFEGTKAPVAKCETCDLLGTLDNRDEALLQAFYDFGGAPDAGSRFRSSLAFLENAIRKQHANTITSLCHKKGRMLEVGCGHGGLLRIFAAKGWDVSGTELSSDIAKSAQIDLGKKIRVGHLEALDFPEAHFDLIVFWHVFEHLPFPRQTLSHAARLLSKNGVVVIAVPNVDSLQAHWYARDWLHLDVPRHRWHFSSQTLNALASECGLVPQHVWYFSFEYGVFGMFEGALAKMGLGHTLYTRVLRRPFNKTSLWKEPWFWTYVALALPLAIWFGAATALEWLAAKKKKGGCLVASFCCSEE